MTALDGCERHVTVSGAPLRDGTRHIVGAVLLVRDVTERRSLEQQTSRALHALLAMAEALVHATKPGGSPTTEMEPSPHSVAHYLLTLTHHVLSCQRISLALLEPETGKLSLVAEEDLSAEQHQQERRDRSLLFPGNTLAPAWAACLAAGDVVSFCPSSRTAAASFPAAGQTLLLPMSLEGHLIGVLAGC
jgi:hypothetical protein